ncbi:crossover junction endodeoxyribonuclease RuvC, partial [gut metagenome]
MDIKSSGTDTVILGIDPGTYILGYGVIRVYRNKPVYVDMGVIDLRKIGTHFEKIAEIYRQVDKLIGRFHPDILSIES